MPGYGLVSDRQAALFVLASFQQRLYTADEYAAEVGKIRRDRRRLLLRELHDEMTGGVEALGERDFAHLCEVWGIPEPSRQVRRRTASGVWVYDNVWNSYGVTAEINGAQHLEPEQAMRDTLKQNEMRLDGHVVVQIPNLALRVNPRPFMQQLVAALRQGGWPGPVAARRSA